MISKAFWQGKKVFVTGHTGFKGSWLCLWLSLLGAEVTGYALQPPTQPNMYELCKVSERVTSIIGDIRSSEFLGQSLCQAQAEIVIHLAAQPLVIPSYENPVETYEINVMGTVNVLEAVRCCPTVKAVINVTTDKCYDNKEWLWGYRENEPLGGYDPYSSSKACSELVTASYRSAFFNPLDYLTHGVGIASARAGNVIGGGDWGDHRLLPHCLTALLQQKKLRLRNPWGIRPWQHVLEPLHGYLLLAEKLYEDGSNFSESWNFGPQAHNAKSVEWMAKELCQLWGQGATYEVDIAPHPHEAHYLTLDCAKANARLAWYPRWNLKYTLLKTIQWLQAYQQQQPMDEISVQQIQEYIFSKNEVDQ